MFSLVSSLSCVLLFNNLVYFDRDLKVAFDKLTKVALGAGDYPTALPLLPNVKDATLCNSSCMVSMEVVLLEDAVTSEAKNPGRWNKASVQCQGGERRFQPECGVLASFV